MANRESATQDQATQAAADEHRTLRDAGELKSPREPRGLWERILPKTLRKMLQNPLAVVGMVLLLFFIGVAVAAPWLAPPENPDSPYNIPRDGYGQRPEPPNPEAWTSFPPDWTKHPLGTTEGQYDIYYGLIWGTRSAFRFGLIIVGLSVFIGIIMGSLAGFFGRWVDELIMRLVDILLAFPNLLLAVVLITIFSSPIRIFGQSVQMSGFAAVIVALVTFGWLLYARVLRGDILTVKDQEYVNAARAAGASSWRLIRKHVLPNAIYPVFVVATLQVGSVVITVATLSFFGLGPPIGYADWGQLISFTRQWIIGTKGDPLTYWYTFVPPATAITLFVLAWNLIGDAFRDVMDPRMRGR